MRWVQRLVGAVGWHGLGPFGVWQTGHTTAVRDVEHFAGGCLRDVPFGGTGIGDQARGIGGFEPLLAVQDLDSVMSVGEYEHVAGVEERWPAVARSHGRSHRRMLAN